MTNRFLCEMGQPTKLTPDLGEATSFWALPSLGSPDHPSHGSDGDNRSLYFFKNQFSFIKLTPFVKSLYNINYKVYG
jgi:hypothetical protein